MDESIKYMTGYKYQLYRDYTADIVLLGHDIKSDYIELTPDGILTIKKGYAWDGASGPTIDTKSSIRGSLEHDALYQLMRQGLLPIAKREFADWRLRKTCVNDGMSKIRSYIWFTGVRMFAGAAADQKNRKQVLTAP